MKSLDSFPYNYHCILIFSKETLSSPIYDNCLVALVEMIKFLDKLLKQALHTSVLFNTKKKQQQPKLIENNIAYYIARMLQLDLNIHSLCLMVDG